MLFNSFQFLVFFIITSFIYYSIGHRFRWLLLLLSSCIFYMYFIPIYILILFLTIIIDFYSAILIESVVEQKRRLLLILSLFSNILILAVFKYYNFFIDNINFFVNTNLTYLPIILPIGLSFHTFQAMSYTIEVYRGAQKAERHLGIYALYVMFFPQLVAGPIERPQNMLHQFKEFKYFNFDNLFSGLRIILFGLFKKVVIADRLAIVVDEVYNHPYNYHGLAFIVVSIFFAIQIYCDFSGYSDIAIGTARVLGFNLMTNFNQPYFSKNISEFWTKWHISLSTWFKDYLYIPLGGNRVAKSRFFFNILVVFLISGLWHGANWTFIVWGAIHGLLLILYNMNLFPLSRLVFPDFFKVSFTFLLVCLAWIFFRSENMHMANFIFKRIFDINDPLFYQLSVNDNHGLPNAFLGLPLWKLILTSLLIPVLFFFDKLIVTGFVFKVKYLPARFSFLIYFAFIISILIFGVFDTKEFIYFQF